MKDPPRLIVAVLLIGMMCLSGCATAEKDYAVADEATRQTVGVDWLDMSENAWRETDDGNFEPWVKDDIDPDSGEVIQTREQQLDRRRRKFETWGVRTASVLQPDKSSGSGEAAGEDP